MGDNSSNSDGMMREITHLPSSHQHSPSTLPYPPRFTYEHSRRARAFPQLAPQPTPPPPQLKPLPPFPTMVTNQNEQKEEDTDEMSEDEGLMAKAVHYHRALGQVCRLLCSSHKNQSEQLRKCDKTENEPRAANDELKVQLHKLEQEIVCIGNKNEKIVKKAAEDVRLAKLEETNWRDKYVKLNEDTNIYMLLEKVREHEATINEQEKKVLELEMNERKLKKLAEEKEKKLDLFRTKVAEDDATINKYEMKVRSLESSERKLNELLKDKLKNGKMLEGKYEKKSDELKKLKGDFNQVKKTAQELDVIIANFVKKDKANEIKLEEKQNHLKTVESSYIFKCEELSKSKDAYNSMKTINHNLVTRIDNLEEKRRDLKDLIKLLEKRKDEFQTTTFGTTVETARSIISTKQRKGALSSSFEQEAKKRKSTNECCIPGKKQYENGYTNSSANTKGSQNKTVIGFKDASQNHFN